MSLVYLITIFILSYIVIRCLSSIFAKTEKDEETAKIETQKQVLLVVLSVLVTFTVEQIPNVGESIDNLVNYLKRSTSQSTMGDIEIPKINIGIGEMKMDIDDIFMVPYTFDSPEGYGHPLRWNSSNEKCVSVSADGELHAKEVGQSIISVSLKNSPDTTLATFRVFVFEPETNTLSYSPLELEYDCVCQQPNNEDTYLVFFNIIRNEPINISKIQINLFTDTGVIPYEEIYSADGSSHAKSNCAGIFTLDYGGTYLVICTAIDQKGNTYQSAAHILRPWNEIDE